MELQFEDIQILIGGFAAAIGALWYAHIRDTNRIMETIERQMKECEQQRTECEKSLAETRGMIDRMYQRLFAIGAATDLRRHTKPIDFQDRRHYEEGDL